MDKKLIEQLQEMPKPEEIKTNPDGSQYLPRYVVEGLLDQYFDNWDTTFFSIEYTEMNRRWQADATVTLIVYHNGQKITRKGAATKEVSSVSQNQHFSETMLSLATVNAAKKLGNRFGRLLNCEEEEPKTESKKKMIPDLVTVQQRKMALEAISVIDRRVKPTKLGNQTREKLMRDVAELEEKYDFSNFEN